MKTIGLILLFFISVTVKSQAITDIEIPTNYKLFKSNNMLPVLAYSFVKYNDSLLDLSTYMGDTATNELKQKKHYLINRDLTIVDSFTVYQRGNYNIPYNGIQNYHINSKIILDYANNTKYYFFQSPLSDSLFNVDIYTTKSNGIEPDSLVFTKTMFNRDYLSEPYIFDTSIVLMSSNATASLPDTGYIQKYNFNSGLLLNERKIDYSSMNLFFNYPEDFPLYLYHSPKKYFDIDSLFHIESSPSGRQLYVLSLNNLSTHINLGINKAIDDSLFLNHNIGNVNARGFHLDSSGIEIGGYISKYTPFSSPDEQFGHLKIGFDSTVQFIKIYGDTTIDERVTNFISDKDVRYLLGADDDSSYLNWLALRTMQVYRITPLGYDSIFIYGNKNHIPTHLIPFDNEIFICSNYSNARSDSSLKIVVTKVPIGLITSSKAINPKQSSLIVYPNPTENWLKSDQFNYGTDYRIFNLKGQLVEERQIDASEQIDVANLPKGNYILVLLEKGIPKARSFHFVKQ